jgi:outer membrane protein OmpA-like peptidoglycan-associated protein
MDGGDFRKLPYTLSYDANSFTLFLSSNMILNIANLTHNQKETQNLLNNVSDNPDLVSIRSGLNLLSDKGVKAALDDISGVFLINALYIGSQKDMGARLYDRLSSKTEDDFDKKINIWFQYDISGASASGEESQKEKISASGGSIDGGFDFMNNEKMVLGVYLSYESSDIKQDKDKAALTSVGGGLYGISFRDKINILFYLGADMGSYKVDRESVGTESSFNAAVIRGGAEIEGKLMMIKPYIGMDGFYAITPQIDEKGEPLNLLIDANSFMRIDAKGGFKYAYNKGIYGFTAKAYAGYILSGKTLDYSMGFAQSPAAGKMNINNSEVDSLFFGGAAGGSVILSNAVKAFASIGLNMSANADLSYLIRLGIDMSFGSKEQGKENRLKKQKQKELKEEEDRIAQEEAKIAQEQQLAQEEADAQKLKDEEIARLKEEIEKAKAEKMQAEFAQFAAKTLDDYAIKEAKERRNKPDIKSFKLSAAIFKTGSQDLLESSKTDLKKLAQNIEKYTYKKVVVEGHADATGNEKRNQVLSEQRARAVFNELYKNGIRNMEYIGFGSMIPATTNDTAIGRTQNRRVEVFVE